MNDRTTPCGWWNTPAPAPAAITPLEAIRLTVNAMEQGEVVPAAAASVMAPALRAYLNGLTNNLNAALGLKARRGGRDVTPLAKEKRRDRDFDIKQMCERQPGTKEQQVEKTAQVLKALPDVSCITDEQLKSDWLRLHYKYGGKLITSQRSVWRAIRDPEDATEPP